MPRERVLRSGEAIPALLNRFYVRYLFGRLQLDWRQAGRSQWTAE